jgi:CYTH domain-containing protein
MAVETELKFNVPAARLKALAKPRFRGGKIGAPTEHDLVSTYFDTAKHKLKRHGLTLRVRRLCADCQVGQWRAIRLQRMGNENQGQRAGLGQGG